MFPAPDDYQTLALQATVLGRKPLDDLLQKLEIELPQEVLSIIPR